MLDPKKPHTRAKHEILTYYLKAWFPILGSRFPRLIYVDGFSGPGEYADGGEGSPILALNAAKNYFHGTVTSKLQEIVFIFVEKDRNYFDNLRRILGSLDIPAQFRVESRFGTFEQNFEYVLSEIRGPDGRSSPSFVFLDPFGVKGFPMDSIKILARQPSVEVLINYNYSALLRWCTEFSKNSTILDDLYGDSSWRQALDIADTKERGVFLFNEYRNALTKIGLLGPSFKMINKRNQRQYDLIFGSKRALGMRRMKEAMWKVVPTGDFSYFDLANPNQLPLFDRSLDREYAQDLADIIHVNRKGTTITKDELLQSEVSVHPTAIDRHLTQALKILELEPPRIAVKKSDGSRRRAGTYKDCQISVL